MQGKFKWAFRIMIGVILLLSFSAFAVSGRAYGQKGSTQENEPAGGPTSLEGSWLDGSDDFTIPWERLVYGTAFVIAIACVGVFLLKKLNGGLSMSRRRRLEVLELRAVARKTQLCLVRVGRKVILFAARGDGVTKLAQFTADELPDAEPEAGDTVPGPFKEMLKRIAGAKR